MEVQVLQGRFVEVPTSEAPGIDRRAFGEIVGSRGELASYAFDWTTGSERRIGRLSVGIGAGHPRGRYVHAVLFEHEDSHGFSLTDELFERVQQGRPPDNYPASSLAIAGSIGGLTT